MEQNHDPELGNLLREWRVPFESLQSYVRAKHTRCIQCGNPRVRQLPGRDGIDRMSKHPLSLLAAVLLAPIYHCNPCRLQYHDWRGQDPAAARPDRGKRLPIIGGPPARDLQRRQRRPRDVSRRRSPPSAAVRDARGRHPRGVR